MNELQFSDYQPLYLGEAIEEFDFNGEIYCTPPNYNKSSYASFENTSCNIFIDTTITTSFEFGMKHPSPLVEHYPVTITNTSKEAIAIGSWNIMTQVQARDTIGLWRMIETNWTGVCGTDSPRIILKENHIAISPLVIYNGNYETELRIKLGNNYSNVIKGRINKGQFESDIINTPPPEAE